MKSIKESIKSHQGEHDASKVYDDLYNDVEKYLDKWGTNLVYGWKGDKGIAFPVTKGNAKKDDWIVIIYNQYSDSFSISLSTYGTDERDEAREWRDNVYAGEEHLVIDKMLGF